MIPEGLSLALEVPGLIWLVLASVASGLVYGFAGFGSALVFTPVAVALVPPEVAVAAFSICGAGSLFTVLPGAWRAADKPGVLVMVVPAIGAMVLGLLILSWADPVPLRWAISSLVVLTLVVLMSGWRYHAHQSLRRQAVVGAASGFVGGATGLTGPVVILFNLASDQSAIRARGNTASFLTLLNVTLLPGLWLTGGLRPESLWLGLVLLPVYAIGSLGGRLMFRPGAETLYRTVAYLVIGCAAVAGLPLFDTAPIR